MTEKTPESHETKDQGPPILFPEIIGISVLAILLPLPLAHLLLSGHVLAGFVALLFWLAALFSAVRLIWRRKYNFVWLPTLALIALFLVVKIFIESL